MEAFEEREFRRAFALIDTDKSGTIEEADFEILADAQARGRRWPLGGEDHLALRAVFEERWARLAGADVDADGRVTLDEWLAFCASGALDGEIDRIIEQTVFGAFASDNNAGVHPEILAAIERYNVGYAGAYGADIFTARAVDKIRRVFGDCEVFFVYTGTAANVLGLKAVTASWQSVLCPTTAHICNNEAAAPESFLGSKLIGVATPDGKLTVPLIDGHRVPDGVPDHLNPTRVVSITNPTEVGTTYQPEEIRAIADYCHDHGMLLQLDGARIFNAAIATGASLKALTSGAGVDIFSLGGTKNGMMMGEAVVFFDQSLSESFVYLQRQAMQTLSKMRFIAVQFEALLSNDLWLRNARQANEMAELLGARVAATPGLELDQPVCANGVFVRLSPEVLERLQYEAYFYVWNPAHHAVRWMTSYDTTREDVESFMAIIERLLDGR